MLPILVALSAAAPPAGSALPLNPGYAEARRFPARHAHQAAAADGRFAYAVSGTHVARHDRGTGAELAAATSPGTKHLNSAFVWKGKVYCAHSNYPATPEQSDVRVFDPAADTLAVAHRFERPPGSLTWLARDPADRHWWVCFAKYGKDNTGTVLVRADDDFREQARWTFPPQVVADWDGMSASGGLWDGGTLLVTHHHFKVLYRLRVPERGTALEFVEAVRSPFPGQGIARDPVGGGLVGIDRGRKAVVFADRER